MASLKQNRRSTEPAVVMRPGDVERYYGISLPTRWRWERLGWLPARDVFVAGRPYGWRRDTIERAAAGPSAARAALPAA
jgi:hypothetical protein